MVRRLILVIVINDRNHYTTYADQLVMTCMLNIVTQASSPLAVENFLEIVITVEDVMTDTVPCAP